MVHRKFIAMFAVALMVGSSLAMATGIPDPQNSWVELACGDCTPVMFNVPNGTGSAFTEARTLNGPVDATVTLYLRDANNDPVVNYPAEDIFLTSSLDY